MATTETPVRPLPGSYSEMYPGRFLKADMLKGRKVTITITAIDGEDLIGENNKAKAEWILHMAERPLQIVLNKTNAFCLYRMFGGNPRLWIGKKIIIYPTKTKFGRDTLDCIRIWGSPELAEDMEISVPQGRKKAWETTMHRSADDGPAPVSNPAVEKKADLPPPDEQVEVSERDKNIFGLLAWSPAVQANWLRANKALTSQERTAKLEAALDD